MDKDEQGFMHDITPDEWTNFLGQPFQMTDDFAANGLLTYTFIKGKVDVTTACRADVKPLMSGIHKLVIVIMKGNNPALELMFDTIMENNMHYSDINVDCESSKTQIYYCNIKII